MVLDRSETVRKLTQFTEGGYVLLVMWSGQIVNRWFFIRHKEKGRAGFGRVRLTLKVNFGVGANVSHAGPGADHYPTCDQHTHLYTRGINCWP